MAHQKVDWQSRAHFFGLASQTMRRILVDYARQRNAGKRNAAARVSLDEQLLISEDMCDLVSDLDEALDRLAQLNPRQAKVVELRFFSGLKEDEIAEVLAIYERTVKLDWRMARAWLYGELSR
jgi:RNA polymerase sigma-70 factor (ECF subfamily)